MLSMVLGVMVFWTIGVESTTMCRFFGKVGGGWEAIAFFKPLTLNKLQS